MVNESMAGASSKPTPMTQLISNGEQEKNTLESLNCTRNNFLANFDGSNMTPEQQEEAAHYLTQLDCTSVLQAADFA